MKELEYVKTIAESQLIELNDNLRDERKQKHIYKQQLDDQIQKVKQQQQLRNSYSCFGSFLFIGISSSFKLSTSDTKWYTYKF